MKTTKLTALLLGAATLVVAGSAQAVGIAGWNFSQFVAPGILTVDGETGADTLRANYSELDATRHVGPTETLYGTLYYDGQFGSSDIEVDATGTEAFNVAAGVLTSNQQWPIGTVPGPPFVNFNSDLASQVTAGWTFANPLYAILNDPTAVGLQIVFGVDATDFGAPGITDWSLSLAGITLSGNHNLLVEFSDTGAPSDYDPITTFVLTPLDTLFTANLSSQVSTAGFVRLTFQGGGNLPGIDNVGINGTIIPEPGTALLLGTGLAGLVAAGRRRA